MKFKRQLAVTFVIADMLKLCNPTVSLLADIRAEFEHSIYQNMYIDSVEAITRRGLFMFDDRLDGNCSVAVEFTANIIDYLPGEIVLATVTAIDDVNLFARGYNFIINITIPTAARGDTTVPATIFTIGEKYPFMVKNVRAVTGRQEINISGHVVTHMPPIPPTLVCTPPTMQYETYRDTIAAILANKPPAWEFFTKLFREADFAEFTLSVGSVVHLPAGKYTRPHEYTGDVSPVSDTGDNILRDYMIRRMIYVLNLNTLGVLSPDEIRAMKGSLGFITHA